MNNGLTPKRPVERCRTLGVTTTTIYATNLYCGPSATLFLECKFSAVNIIEAACRDENLTCSIKSPPSTPCAPHDNYVVSFYSPLRVSRYSVCKKLAILDQRGSEDLVRIKNSRVILKTGTGRKSPQSAIGESN